MLIPGGTFTIGTSDDPWAYDNERPEHEVTVAPFRIDTTPVTNRAYREFVEAGGYDDPRVWDAPGWAWRQEAALVAPQFWHREGGGAWSRRRFGRTEDLPLDEPVQHVCWYEADAFARWSGARLPTETEWEIASAGATLDHANLWHEGPHRFGPSSVTRSHPGAVSKWGVHQMFGDVWEWTASDFHGYPGFESFPYREYSEVFFGPDYKVLRGGSWATHPAAMRPRFATGTTRSAARSSPASAARATLDASWDATSHSAARSSFRCARHSCRLAYLGPPVTLDQLLFAAPHSLCDQARTPQHQTSGETNPDGWGVGWYVNGGCEPEPATARSPRSGTTASSPRVSQAIETSGAFIGAARLASPGATIDPSGNAPFVSGPWLFSLNGAVGGFRKGVDDQLRAKLSPKRLAGIEGDSDSEVLFALALDRLDAGDSPGAALSSVVEEVTGLTKGRLNMLLTDGHQLAATRYGNSLFVRGTTVVSEPLDDDAGWCEVPDGSLVFAAAGSDHTMPAITSL